MWENKMCSVLNAHCKQMTLYRIGMRKINPSLQFLLPKKPFLQGHTSVNAMNGTLMAMRKEVWSTLFSWVFRIFFCFLEAGMQTWPIHWPQQHQEKLLLYPFQHFSDKCNGIALFWGILFDLTTKFFTKITVFTKPWQFSSIFFLMQVHNETQMFLFPKCFFNKQ